MASEFDAFDPPAELLLDAGAVGRINFQPRWCPPPMECIASRIGDELTLVFAWNGKREPLPAARWTYHLDRIEGSVVIARRIG